MNKEGNRRTRMTKAMLENALLELLQDRPLNEISVTDICRQADLNRSTFYAHYRSPMDLLAAIRDSLVKNAPDTNDLKMSTQERLMVYLRYIRAHGLAFDTMFHLDVEFEKAMIMAIYHYLEKNILNLTPEDTDLERHMLLSFMAAGAAYCVDEWIRGGYPISEESFSDKMVGSVILAGAKLKK
jgi:AcrR family transcriptional regulator